MCMYVLLDALKFPVRLIKYQYIHLIVCKNAYQSITYHTVNKLKILGVASSE